MTGHGLAGPQPHRRLCEHEVMPARRWPHRVGIVVFDDVEVLDCCGPFEVFSVANRVSRRRQESDPFVVSLIARHEEVTARGGLVLRTHQLIEQVLEVDLLIVAGGVTDAVEQDDPMIRWLSAVRATLTASVCTGAFLLAQAGLLRDQQVTTHWEDCDELARRWPGLTVVRDRRWVRDGDVITSAGISAGIDMSLHLVEILADRALAEATARQMDYHWTSQ